MARRRGCLDRRKEGGAIRTDQTRRRCGAPDAARCRGPGPCQGPPARREERVEDALADLCRDARPVIDDAYHCPKGRTSLGAGRRLRAMELNRTWLCRGRPRRTRQAEIISLKLRWKSCGHSETRLMRVQNSHYGCPRDWKPRTRNASELAEQ